MTVRLDAHEVRGPARAPVLASRLVRVVAWASLAAEILLVGTGGAVRLSGSGLGCPTWPRCTAASFTTTPAMGVHGVIEFGNRLLTFVLVVVALAAFVVVVRQWRTRKDLFLLALAQLLSIPAQAVLGGVTVLTHLNPWLVAAHFLFSLTLVVLMTVFVHRARVLPGARIRWTGTVPTALTAAVAVLAAVTVVLGVTTTGSGPHAGDATAPRNGLDPVLLQQVHESVAWLLLLATIALLAAALRGRAALRPVALLIAVEVVQLVVGVTQVALGWAAGLVVVHVFLAACLTAATTAVVLSARAPAAAA
jgi:cytochrome c oxidase assembly protein subunit 15